MIVRNPATAGADQGGPQKAHPDSAHKIPELDGFRAVAVWMVLCAHLLAGWTLPEGATRGIPGPILWVVSRGWLGVDLFFVLSGFLITGILLDSRDRPKFFRNFYGRRVLRIFPLYMVVIAVTWAAYRHPAAYFVISIFSWPILRPCLESGHHTVQACFGRSRWKSIFTLPGRCWFAF